jgi:hypothetical protein
MRGIRSLVFLLVACLALFSGPVLAQAPPFGGEFPVNTYTTGDQDNPAVAIGSDGTFLISWQSAGQDGSNGGVFAQAFDAGGAKIGSELAMNTYTTGAQGGVSAAASRNGTFVVAWQSDGQDGDGPGIFARTIVNNSPVQLQDFQVNTYTTGGQYSPAVAVGDSGFVIVWSTFSPDKKGIFAQRFTPGGAPVGTEFQVNSGTSGAYAPSIAMDGSGNFVVVWDDYRDGSGRGIFGQAFDSSGAKFGPVFPVNTFTTGDQSVPRVAMGKHGDFVAVWTDYSGRDGDQFGVFGQRFKGSAEKVGSEFQVNTHTSAAQYNASVALDSRGDFVVAWNDGYPSPAYGVQGQRFDRTGAKVGPEFRVNVSTSAIHADARISGGGTDTFVVTWSMAGEDGSGEGVFRQRTNPIPKPMRVDAHSSSGTSSDVNGVLEPGESVRVEPAWQNVGGNSFSRTGSASNFTGPGGTLYHILNAAADYGSIPAGATANCFDATSNCYRMTVDAPTSRPSTHWDAMFQEDLSANGSQFWKLHIGDSFSDVPRSQLFYAKIEALLHYGITSGCTATTYCPGVAVPRDQMAIFVAKGIAGTGELVPSAGVIGGQLYDCSPGGHSLFSDVSPTDAACKHVHYLAVQNVTLGCGTGQFCPSQSITRDAMASFIAKAIVAPGGGAAVPVAYTDPDTGRFYSCNNGSANQQFTDVPPSNPFCKHIHYLWAKGVVSGCTATTYCPGGSVNRDAMAKFIANGFGLQLYGP